MARRTSKPFSYLFKNKKKPNRSTHRRSGAIGFETLERREVMAANITATFAGGVLNIEGTPGNDTINVRYDGTNVSVDGAMITSYTPSSGYTGMFVPGSYLNSITVNGLAGNDKITMFESGSAANRTLPMTINGGWGNDTITGGSGSDKLNGFAGSDDAAVNYDNNLGLYIAPQGDYFNFDGKSEKWLKSANTGWYFIKPDGSLYNSPTGYAVGNFVYKFDPSYYTDLSQLADAGSGAAAAALDKAVNLISYGNLYENSGGRQERWVQNWNDQWYFITPDGALYRQTQSGYAIGTLEAKLDPTYWTQISKLLSASSNFTDVDTINGNDGVDYINGGADVDTLVGGEGNDVIHGGAGDDFVWGGYKDNVVPAFYLNDHDRIWGDAGNDQLHGGSGVDRIWGDVGNDKLWGDWDSDFLYGGDNNDYLYGGDNDDQIWGDAGVDRLFGAKGNDRLYGGVDYDYLYGEHGDDWLDAGSAAEYADGGSNGDGSREFDINAWVVTPNIAQTTDVIQGGSPTCWIVASIASAAQTENLANRITYIGGNTYKVNLYNRIDIYNINAGYKFDPVYVTFDGTMIASDPLTNGTEGETWMMIMHRAIIQAVMKFDPTQSLTAPHSGGAADALAILTGKWGTRISSANIGSTNVIANLIASGKKVAIHAKNTGTTKLIATHVYAVVGTSGSNVVLYNPHGSYVTIAWNDFLKDASSIWYV